MKKYLSSLLMLCLLFACENDDKGEKLSNISNVRAEAREGAIMLRWDNPEDMNFLYVSVKYTDLKNGELIEKNVSYHTDSLLIINLLHKDGEYAFTLRTVSNSGIVNPDVLNINCTALKRPPVITEYFDKINVTSSDLSANASDPTEGNLGHLVDGDLGTFYHTNWHETIPFPQWIQFNLKSPVEAVKFISWNRRGYSGGNADSISILGSNDGENWEVLGEIASGLLPSDGGAKYESPVFSIEGKTFTKIRYNALSGTDGNTWFNIAELELHKVWYIIEDPEAE